MPFGIFLPVSLNMSYSLYDDLILFCKIGLNWIQTISQWHQIIDKMQSWINEWIRRKNVNLCYPNLFYSLMNHKTLTTNSKKTQTNYEIFLLDIESTMNFLIDVYDAQFSNCQNCLLRHIHHIIVEIGHQLIFFEWKNPYYYS